MDPRADYRTSLPQAARNPAWRALARGVAFVLAALLAYAVWRGYQNPDLMLDLAALRLC